VALPAEFRSLHRRRGPDENLPSLEGHAGLRAGMAQGESFDARRS